MLFFTFFKLCKWYHIVYHSRKYCTFNPLDTEREDPLDPSRYVFVVFSFLLNFCRQWHLSKFLILGDLSTHLFGLILSSPNPKKLKVGVPTFYLCLYLHIHRHPLDNLALHLLGENLNKFYKLCIFP